MSHFLKQIAPPVDSGDAVNKAYADSLAMRATGTLQAYTSPATQSVLVIQAAIVPANSSANINISLAGGSPNNYTVDNSSNPSPMDAATAASTLSTQINIGGVNYSAVADGDQVTVTATNGGASQTLALTGDWSAVSYTPGTDPSGGILEVVLYTGNGSTGAVLMQNGWVAGIVGGAAVSLYLRAGSDTIISQQALADGTNVFVPDTSNFDNWMMGLNIGESLVAKLESIIPSDGSTCNIGVLFQTTT
jgi:hypothetical protein